MAITVIEADKRTGITTGTTGGPATKKTVASQGTKQVSVPAKK